MIVTAGWYMTLAAILFLIGASGLLLRRNALVMFMSVELMLNAVNLTFVAAARAHGDIGGQMAGGVRLVVGPILFAIFRPRRTASVDELSEMSG